MGVAGHTPRQQSSKSIWLMLVCVFTAKCVWFSGLFGKIQSSLSLLLLVLIGGYWWLLVEGVNVASRHLIGHQLNVSSTQRRPDSSGLRSISWLWRPRDRCDGADGSGPWRLRCVLSGSRSSVGGLSLFVSPTLPRSGVWCLSPPAGFLLTPPLICCLSSTHEGIVGVLRPSGLRSVGQTQRNRSKRRSGLGTWRVPRPCPVRLGAGLLFWRDLLTLAD